MMRTRISLFSLLLVAAMALGGGEAYATSFNLDIGTGIGRPIAKTGVYTDQNQARQAVKEGRALPLGQVLAKVQKQVAGHLLDADLVEEGVRSIYIIKLMTRDGNVAIVSADAASGQILGVKRGGH
jgi:hypothetical protein